MVVQARMAEVGVRLVAVTAVMRGGVWSGTAQLCVVAGLVFVVPQLFKSVQVLVCEPATLQVDQAVQDQFSVQAGGMPELDS